MKRKNLYNPFKMILPYIGLIAVAIFAFFNTIGSFTNHGSYGGENSGYAMSFLMRFLGPPDSRGIVISMYIGAFLIGWLITFLWRRFKK